MGRSDRHKKESKNREFTIRREKSDSARYYQDTESRIEPVSPPPVENYQQEIPKSKKRFGIFPKRPKKPRKRRSFLRTLGLILLALLIFSGVTFAAGNKSAKSDTSIPKAEVETFQGVKADNGCENILLLGSDTRETEQGRADSIMVLQIDGKGKPKMLSFMRDMYVAIPGVGDNKLNASYAYGGAELVRQTLETNFGVKCKYYAKVDFQSFEKGIDAMFPRGVKIDAEKDMSAYIDEPIKKGEQRMNGHTLLNYARFRMDEEGDFGRVRRQQQVMTALFSQMKNPLTLLRGPYAAGKFLGYLSTDIPNSFYLKNSLHFAKAAGGFDRLVVPVEGSWSYGETYEAGSVLIVDTQQNAQAIQNFLGN